MHPVDRPTPRTLQDAFGDGASLCQPHKPLTQRFSFWLLLVAAVLLAAVLLADPATELAVERATATDLLDAIAAAQQVTAGHSAKAVQ